MLRVGRTLDMSISLLGVALYTGRIFDTILGFGY